MTQKTGTCRFCGQTVVVEVPDGMIQEAVDEEAVLCCKCKDAKAYREKKEEEEQIEMAKMSAKGTTFELFHEEFPEIEEVFNVTIDHLVAKKFKKMTINTGGRTKATISFSNGTIKVQREDKSTYSRETDI